MDDHDKKIGSLISATLKKSPSYHSELEEKTLKEIILMKNGKGPKSKYAKEMYKLYSQKKRLIEKVNQKGRF